ncbi:unnamed protein product [Parnassius apollo]|uniref:(apollo) hypothetical protein n=1 Tax=Parnassius apollo TaxID=110799 RepID=A0A8S3WWD0_PARAO|nr:unnamed protein product [Parnassius apollo]
MKQNLKKDEQENTDDEIVNIEDGVNDNADSNDASDITVETTRSSSSGKRKNEENLFKILADNIINKKKRNMETADNDDPDKQFLLSLLPD